MCLTLFHRGQHEVSQFPSLMKFPDAVYYISIVSIFIIHAMIMLIRATMRYDQQNSDSTEQHTYSQLHWAVWVTMLVLPLLGIVVGIVVNRLDDHHYRRYLQFLRLEFDTRLGMHSPR